MTVALHLRQNGINFDALYIFHVAMDLSAALHYAALAARDAFCDSHASVVHQHHAKLVSKLVCNILSYPSAHQRPVYLEHLICGYILLWRDAVGRAASPCFGSGIAMAELSGGWVWRA